MTDRQRTGGKGKIGAPVDFNVPGGSHRNRSTGTVRTTQAGRQRCATPRFCITQAGEGGPIPRHMGAIGGRPALGGSKTPTEPLMGCGGPPAAWVSGFGRARDISLGSSNRLSDASSSDPVPCIVTLIVELTGSGVR